MLRTPFYQNAAVVLSAFRRCGAQCLDEFYSEVRGKALRGGTLRYSIPMGVMGHTTLLCLCSPPVGGMMPRASAGSISSSCPTISCAATGSGTS